MRMVNSGFPAPMRYGFEMVDMARAAIFVSRDRHQSKIYVESNHSNFWRILDDLTSTQTLAIYRRLLVRDSEINCNTIEMSGRGREMFFLLRLVFWVGLVLVLLPRDKAPESNKQPQLGASEAVSAATAAVSDMSQFCKRQPAACEVGGQAATVIGQRAQAGARKLYQIITDKRPPDHTGSIGVTASAGASLVDAAPRDTLTTDDVQVEWRGASPPSP